MRTSSPAADLAAAGPDAPPASAWPAGTGVRPRPGAGGAGGDSPAAGPGPAGPDLAGDGLAELVAREGPRLVRLARALLRDPHQAEDVVQDVLARAVVKRDRLAEVDDPTAYLHRMLVNAVTSWRRRAFRRHEQAADPVALPEDPGAARTPDTAERHAERERCLALLRRLPDRQRVVLVLRLYEDLPDEEIAALLGCTTGTVRSNAHRGLASLRRFLAQESAGEDGRG
ncbi:RNA polymerase sigma factor [Kineococcus terrestris]|uniref:RNA polymerase sigma factor n=1 Tax=Kineococcus terrestris TaxID=2044856 RepID=UPI0034DACE83